MSKERKVLTERDFKKKWQNVYTFTPADLRCLLVGAGIDKKRIEMAHTNRCGHEWLAVTIDCDDGFIYVPFGLYGEEENNGDTRIR